jgi:hypothetical protein
VHKSCPKETRRMPGNNALCSARPAAVAMPLEPLDARSSRTPSATNSALRATC